VNNPEKTYDWQQPYTAAIWETDNLLMEGRISEALSAVEERWLSPVQVGGDEGHALAEADAGIQSLITERTSANHSRTLVPTSRVTATEDTNPSLVPYQLTN
jgi:hypothetical protein